MANCNPMAWKARSYMDEPSSAIIDRIGEGYAGRRCPHCRGGVNKNYAKTGHPLTCLDCECTFTEREVPQTWK